MTGSTMRWEARVATVVAGAVAALRYTGTSFVGGGVAQGPVRVQRASAAAVSAGAAPASEAQGSSVLATATPLVGMGMIAAMAVSRRSRSGVTRSATRTEWYRKVKRIGGDQAIFEVTIPKPLGVKMEVFPKNRGIGISEVVEGGNTDAINRKVCVDDEAGMWVLEGDRVVGVNGTDVEDADLETIVGVVGQSEGDEVTLTLVRNTRKGPIKVVMMPDGDMTTIRRGARLSAAAEWVKGVELKYGCIDGWCGTCWHRERTTNGIFKPCCDVLTGDWDNVVPLVLTPKPEKAGDSSFLNPRGV